jgi:hypothetical protein
MSEPAAPRMGRIKRAREPQPRAIRQEVLLTKEEQDELRERDAAAGVSVPRLLVESALRGGETLAQRQALLARFDRLAWLTANLANNVNQLAHQANSAGQVRDVARIEARLSEVEDLRARVEQLGEALR